MASLWRIVLLVYSIIILVVAGAAVVVAMGRPEPIDYINLVLANPQNRVIVGLVSIIAIIGVIMILIAGLRKEPKPDAVTVDDAALGQILITNKAIKIIIMKAVKQIEGIKEIKPVVNYGSQGLQVSLHMMINPEYSVPELSKQIQTIVKQHLKDIGGLDVSEIRIFVDDLGTANKSTKA
jgi:uncharacterized alkaline shock family protein YloU